jgi:hypothetical protein
MYCVYICEEKNKAAKVATSGFPTSSKCIARLLCNFDFLSIPDSRNEILWFQTPDLHQDET